VEKKKEGKLGEEGKKVPTPPQRRRGRGGEIKLPRLKPKLRRNKQGPPYHWRNRIGRLGFAKKAPGWALRVQTTREQSTKHMESGRKGGGGWGVGGDVIFAKTTSPIGRRRSQKGKLGGNQYKKRAAKVNHSDQEDLYGALEDKKG